MEHTYKFMIITVALLLSGCGVFQPQATSTPAPSQHAFANQHADANSHNHSSLSSHDGRRAQCGQGLRPVQPMSSKYPDNCNIYCIYLPQGSTPKGLAFTTYEDELSTSDINIYVDRSLKALQSEEGFGEWNSMKYLDSTEMVYIYSPEPGPYYLQICNYYGSEAPFHQRITLDQ